MNLEAELHKIIKKYMPRRKQGYCMEEMRALIAQNSLRSFDHIGWRYQFTDGRWAYSHGTKDPREIHDNGRTHQKLYVDTNE